MMAVLLFYLPLPPVSADCSGFSHLLLLPQKDTHSIAKQPIFSFRRFCCAPAIFSICHSIAQFTHAQPLTEYNSCVQSHSPFTTMHILLCQHDFHIKTMFQEHESRTSVYRGLSEILVILFIVLFRGYSKKDFIHFICW